MHKKHHRVALEAMDDRVVVLPDEPAKVSRGGVHLASRGGEQGRHPDRPVFGTVVAVGPGRPNPDAPGGRDAPSVRAGDRVVLPEYGGTRAEYDGTDYVFLREGELLALLRD